MGKRAIIYARVSTDDQRGNFSIPTQIAECMHYLQGKGYALVGDRFVNQETGQDARDGIAAFVDDYSSRELNRPGLDAAFSYLESYGYDVVVIHALDRLARDPYIRQTLEMELNRKGAKAEYALGNYEETPEGEVRKDLDATFAKWETARRVERSNRGKRGKAQRGLFVCGRAPYGYTVDLQSPGGLVVNETQARVVRQIFDLYVNEGTPMRSIVNILNQGEARPSLNGEVWQKSSVARILHNTAYVGTIYYNKYKRNGKKLELRDRQEWIGITITPIVDEYTFTEAQHKIEWNRNFMQGKRTRAYLLTGMIFCEDCGKPYFAQTAPAGKNRRTNEAQSYRHRVKAGHCKNHMISARKLDPLVWQQIIELLLDPGALRAGYTEALQKERSSQDRQQGEKLELLKQFGKLDEKQNKLTQAYLDPDINLTKTEYLDQRTQIEGEKKALTKRITEIEQDLSSLPTPEEFASLENFSDEIRKRITSAEWQPTERNKRRVLELLHVKVFMSKEAGARVTGWFGETKGTQSTTREHYVHRLQQLPERV